MGLPDRVQRSQRVRGEEVLHRFGNGLTLVTEVLHKADRLRILPLGTPQGALMNHLLNFPDSVRGRRVFEPFAGSGALGFMALRVGAPHVVFLDINPRAAEFQRTNAARNRIPAERFTSLTGDIAEVDLDARSDLILANPPFVPTPDGIEGTLSSNGGPDGSRLVEILLRRLDAFLEPSGRALIYLFQWVREGRPLILDALPALLRRRPGQLTPAQRRPIPLETWFRAYRRLFPKHATAIGRWRSDLTRRHGEDLALCHYVLDVGPRAAGAADCRIRDDFAEKFGESFLVPSADPEELAFGRVFENVVPGRRN